MNMKKMFAGLIALVAGFALSAGGALATKGYMTGDPAMMKLIPHFETGDNRATLIAVHNMSPQEMSTMDLNADVSDLEAYLGGAAPTETMATNLNLLDGISGVAAAATLESRNDLDAVAAVEKALEAANRAKHTEHLFIKVNVYDKEGMMMGGDDIFLCLAENQSGYVILQGPEMQDWQMEVPNQGKILSVMDGDIPEGGYVKLMAENQKFTGCGVTAPNQLMEVTLDTPGSESAAAAAKSMIATWAIIQDTGMGFFGTEVPTATISMNAKVGDADMAELACYALPTQTITNSAPTIPNARTTGAFDSSRCGLIPERHDNTRTTAGDIDSALTATTATPRAHAFARYDTMGDSMIYVWLAAGMDTDETLPKDRRMLEVSVMCMDGTMPPGPDRDLDNQPDPILVPAPYKVTMIDPADMDGLGMYTDMCDDARGVLKIMMPDASQAGMVFTHLSQAGDSYRMNFPGYSMASDAVCNEATITAGGC